MENQLFVVERLEGFIRGVLLALGVSEDHARICAVRMIEADLRGMHGHGVFRLPGYCRRFEAGGYNLKPDIQVMRETPVSAVVDGDNGLGQVVVTFAAELAIQVEPACDGARGGRRHECEHLIHVELPQGWT